MRFSNNDVFRQACLVFFRLDREIRAGEQYTPSYEDIPTSRYPWTRNTTVFSIASIFLLYFLYVSERDNSACAICKKPDSGPDSCMCPYRRG
jgi:hypothetical protein